MERKKPDREQTEETKQSRWGFRGMTVRDWLQLLIVPLALVGIGFLFTMQQNARQQAIEDQRADSDRQIEEQRAQDEALQLYLDQMSTLLLEKDLSDDKVRTLMRARTLTVLGRLDPSRKTQVIRFLGEANLVQKRWDDDLAQELGQNALTEDSRPSEMEADVMALRRDTFAKIMADFEAINAPTTPDNAPFIALEGADLSDADLSSADLTGADLTGANLSGADLSSPSLSHSRVLWAGLMGADLTGADLRGADLSGAYLTEANLKLANLKGAEGITNEELEEQAASLEGATMPDGSKHP